MAQTQYRGNLSAKDFVYLSEQWGRSVIVKGFDQNFSRQIVSANDPDKDIGIPQIYYCHNVMPVGQGFGAISYTQLLSAVPNETPNFTHVRYVNDLANNGFCYLAFDVVNSTTVNIYKFNPGTDSNWIYVTAVTTALSAGLPFTATINGQTYIYFSFVGCFTYSTATNLLTPVTLTGLSAGNIVGITQAFGYMIAWATNAVYWSSTVTSTDFTPSLVTGAGGGQVQQTLGNIGVCVANVFGFIIYSDKNAVSAVYSGNSRYPFNFRPVVSGGGCVDYGLITVDPDTGNQYAFTTAGLQVLSVTQAVNTFPELTNFLDGSRFEDFDDTLLRFSQTIVSAGTMRKRITTVASRYLVISYGLPGLTYFTHALIYDSSMKRWGKLKIIHNNCFEYISTFQFADQQSRQSIAFIQANGAVFKVLLQQDSNSTFNQANNNGTMILGKYQHTRNRYITLQELDIETVGPGGVTVNVGLSLDGKTIDSWTPMTRSYVADSNISQTLYTRKSGLNFSLCVQGDFNMDSFVLAYTPSGRR